jgi:transcriptional regulator with XRE-family HTH domain
VADETKTAFGRVLRRARMRAGISQEELGLQADVARNFVSLMELGQNQPTIETLFRLAKALGCRPSELLQRVEKELDSLPVKRQTLKRRASD